MFILVCVIYYFILGGAFLKLKTGFQTIPYEFFILNVILLILPVMLFIFFPAKVTGTIILTLTFIFGFLLLV